MTLLLRLLAVIMLQTALMSFAWSAEPIGRLFSTPSERGNLDQLRQSRKKLPTKVESLTEAAPVVAPSELPQEINLQGYVKRHDGKAGTVWVNNKALQENTGNADVRVGKLPDHSNRIPMRMSANGKQLSLKAGQVYDPENNRVREARNHGAQGDSGTIGD